MSASVGGSDRGALLSIAEVTKEFATGTLAVDRIDLAIHERDFVSLVGPSGCGKSTLLRMIAGLVPPTTGRITWSGAKPRLGFVFQDATLMPWASVRKNVELGLELQGAERSLRAERADVALALVGLGDVGKAFPRELSGGMRMRVSIARALAAEPAVLLMDEPFAALDEFTRERLNDELLALWAEQRLTIVFVTHSVYESVYLSNRISVMSGRPGRITDEIQIDAPFPRDASFRSAATYHAYCERVSRALRRPSPSSGGR